MIREALDKDRDRLETLLLRRVDGAMFPLTNLRTHGLGDGGFASDHRTATRFWFVDDVSMVALTQRGMLMALLDPSCDLAGLPKMLAGMTLTGAVGPALSIRPALLALGLKDQPARLDEDEPGFALALADLHLSDLPGATLAPLAAAPRDLMIQWRAASMVENQGMPHVDAPAKAAEDVQAWLDANSHRVLFVDGQPVALTGFNAQLPEIVQVGGVYTPPDLRNRGYARTAVALHLAEVRASGTSRAVLFAATPAAVRAYRALGFQPAPDFALVLFRHPVTLPT
ncbi:MAG: GNAT family N-acetyltransferase [Tabrizicola sp.]|nr:GNAT family N-acetyltransferase [Tabrizicola sp.]